MATRWSARKTSEFQPAPFSVGGQFGVGAGANCGVQGTIATAGLVRRNLGLPLPRRSFLVYRLRRRQTRRRALALQLSIGSALQLWPHSGQRFPVVAERLAQIIEALHPGSKPRVGRIRITPLARAFDSMACGAALLLRLLQSVDSGRYRRGGMNQCEPGLTQPRIRRHGVVFRRDGCTSRAEIFQHLTQALAFFCDQLQFLAQRRGLPAPGCRA